MIYLLLFAGAPLVVSCLFSALFTALTKKLSRSNQFIAEPDESTYHEKTIPLGGGIAILSSIFATVACGLILATSLPVRDGNSVLSIIGQHQHGIFSRLKTLSLVGGGGICMFFIGLWDDRTELSPWKKLLFETLIAVIIAAGGIRITLFLESGTVLGASFRIAVTVAWIVLVTNSFNLLDNMDGQCAGISTIICLVLGILAFQTGQYFLMAMLFTLTGTCIGFLFYNFPPASIFAGDSGSLVLGYFIAILMILFTFYRYKQEYPVHAYLSPLLLMAIPFFDTLSVVWIRLKEKRPLFQSDTSHFSHRLVERGLSEKGAFFIVMLIVSITGLFSLTIYQTNRTGALLLVLSTLGLLWVIRILEGAES